MPLSIGIVGLPNVGKSTLFNALTKEQVSTSNYPFCTIDPNVGVVKVPDERLDQLAKVLKPNKVLPTTIEFVDIAGLVKNAYKGEGLGNRFLSYIREVDAIVEILRTFNDANVSHIEGKVDPGEDKEIIDLELIMADLETIEKALIKVRKQVKSVDKGIIKIKDVLEKIKVGLEEGKAVRELSLTNDEYLLACDLNLLTMKPILYIYNIDESSQIDTNITKDSHYIKINIKLEQELSELNHKEQVELGLESKLNQLIKASYKLLDIITFFTTQNNILQAWTVEKNSRAPKAAGKIHTDFIKGFIRAEIISWQKLVEVGSEQRARERGLVRTEGKDYIVQEGDVCHFLFSK